MGLVVLPAAGAGATEVPCPPSGEECSPPSCTALGDTIQALSAEPFLPLDHWSREALRRLAAIGALEPGEAALSWPAPRARVRALLRHAALDTPPRSEADPMREAGSPSEGDVSPEEDPAEEAGPTGEAGGDEDPSRSAARRLAAGFLHRFEQEYPEPGGAHGFRWSGRIDAGWAGRDGRLRAGTHDAREDGGWEYRGPVPLPEASSAVLRPTLDLAFGSTVALSADLETGPEGIRAGEIYGSGRIGDVDLWAGRRGLALGPATPSAVVLSDGALFHGVGAELHEGRRLPGFLTALGPVTGATLLGRMERSGEVRRPWFWAARVAIAPRDDLSVGVNRAAIFGGEGNDPVTLRNVGLMLLGVTETGSKSSDFENQVASVDFLWRTGPERVPFLLRGEWGFADVGGAWFRVPGIVGAVEVPVVPGAPFLGVGLEHASFSGSGRGHPPWYRHGPLGEGWTDRGRLLAHPLAGHGTEWAVHLRLDPGGELEGSAAPASGRTGSPWQAAAALLRRHRGEENLFAGDREGASVGGSVRVFRRGPTLRLDGEVEWESGRAGWRSWAVRLSMGAGF